MRPTLFLSRRAVLGGTIGATLLPHATAMARADLIYTRRFSDLGLNGHDPVAYATLGRPAEGARRFSTRWNDATWRFVSAENRDAFAADPARYAPQYGGYCAWATAKGYLAPGDPRFWRIVDGKLYVNYDGDVQLAWEKDVRGFIRSADANWPFILEKN